MKPEAGQNVKCFLKNSTVVEGIVQEWGDSQVILKSLHDQSILIIHHPSDDIVMTKISAKKVEVESGNNSKEIKQKIVEKLREVEASQADPDLNKLHIEQLHQLAVEQDKVIIKEKIQEHFPSTGGNDMTGEEKYTSPFYSSPRKATHGNIKFYTKQRPK